MNVYRVLGRLAIGMATIFAAAGVAAGVVLAIIALQFVPGVVWLWLARSVYVVAALVACYFVGDRVLEWCERYRNRTSPKYVCSQGHVFREREAEPSDALDGAIECPFCGDTDLAPFES